MEWIFRVRWWHMNPYFKESGHCATSTWTPPPPACPLQINKRLPLEAVLGSVPTCSVSTTAPTASAQKPEQPELLRGCDVRSVLNCNSCGNTTIQRGWNDDYIIHDPGLGLDFFHDEGKLLLFVTAVKRPDDTKTENSTILSKYVEKIIPKIPRNTDLIVFTTTQYVKVECRYHIYLSNPNVSWSHKQLQKTFSP